MPKKRTQKIAVDANVGRSAGNTDDAPCSLHSRGALKAIRERRLVVVMSNTFEEEWKRTESRFSRIWRVSMQQRGLMFRLEQEEFSTLRKKIEAIEDQSFPQVALLKDFHVVACALATDRVIVSNEVRLKKHLVRFGTYEPQVLKILWTSPSHEGAACAEWLASGAKHQHSRLLSQVHTD